MVNTAGRAPAGPARRSFAVLVVSVGAVAAIAVAVFLLTTTNHSSPVATDTSPVNLATPVDMANGTAHPSAVVRVGAARIEVLGPTLLRLEYSPRARFENAPTVNALDRRMTVPKYRARVAAGWLTLTHEQDDLALPRRIGALHRGQHIDSLRRRRQQ